MVIIFLLLLRLFLFYCCKHVWAVVSTSGCEKLTAGFITLVIRLID